MRGFAAVFTREIAERRLLFLLGLCGLVPLFLPAVVQSSLRADELRAASAAVLAAVVGAVLAVGLGSSVLARDLAERRLGFYFARPLSGWAIWAGKLAAALALSVGIGALVLLPALLVSSGMRSDLPVVGSLLTSGVLLAALVLLANVVSTLVRTRSPWLALDLAAAGAVGLLIWSAAQQLLRAGRLSMIAGQPALPLFQNTLWSAAPVAVAAVLAGSAAQVVGGRTDPRRGHRLLSLTLWGLLLAGAVGFQGYSRWVLAATPADLTAVGSLTASPAGNAVVLQGPAAHRRGYWPVFLTDPRSGRFSRLFPAPSWNGSGAIRFSADGRSAVWFETSGLEPGPMVLVRLDLTRPGARPVPTRLTLSALPVLFDLSPDGRRLASLDWNHRLAVEEIDTARLLAAVQVEPYYRYQSRLRFTDDDHVLALGPIWVGPRGRPQSAIEAARLDLGTGHLETLGQTLPTENPSRPEISPDGSHFLVHQPRGSSQLYRTEGAVPVAELPASAHGGGFLADGRILTSEGADGARQLVLFSPEGAFLRRFPFPGARALRPAGEPILGQLVVGVAATPAPANPANFDGFARWEVRLLDLATGESRPLGRGLLPMGDLSAGPESLGPRLFLRGGGRLVLLDPESGRERRVAGGQG
jgi:hypothetical protein